MTPVLATIKSTSIEMLGAFERDPTWTPGEDSRGRNSGTAHRCRLLGGGEELGGATSDENGAKVRARRSTLARVSTVRIETSPFDGGGSQ